MPIPQIEDVRPILEDFELRLRRVIEEAWSQDWATIPDRHRALFDKTTRANCLFNAIRQRALAEFDGDPEVRVIPHGRTVKFLFRNRVLVRLKKANRYGLGSNIQTQAVLDFVNPQLPLFDLPEIYHIEVNYQEDMFARCAESVAAVCRQGFRKIWSYELRQIATNVTPLPTGLAAAPEPATVRVREQAEKPDSGPKE